MHKRFSALSLWVAAAVSIGVGCSGGDRPELDAVEPLLTPTAAVDVDEAATSDDDDAVIDADGDSSDDDVATADPDAGESGDSGTEPDGSSVDVDPDDLDPIGDGEPLGDDGGDPTETYAEEGTATVAFVDGRTFEGVVSCQVTDEAGAWEFAFKGFTSEGVQIEGVYDSADPDFVIVFVAGADSLSGDDVLFSNINGGEDLIESSEGGTTWEASIRLTDLNAADAALVDAQVTATCP